MVLQDHMQTKTIDLHYHTAYGHQTWQDGD